MGTWTHLLMTDPTPCKRHVGQPSYNPQTGKPGKNPCAAYSGSRFYDTTVGAYCWCLAGTCGDTEVGKCVPRKPTGDPLQDQWDGTPEGHPWPHGMLPGGFDGRDPPATVLPMKV